MAFGTRRRFQVVCRCRLLSGSAIEDLKGRGITVNIGGSSPVGGTQRRYYLTFAVRDADSACRIVDRAIDEIGGVCSRSQPREIAAPRA